MSEKFNSEGTSHHKQDEAELDRLEEMGDENAQGGPAHHARDEAELSRLEDTLDGRTHVAAVDDEVGIKPRTKFAWILTAVIVGLIGIIALAWIATKDSSTAVKVEAGAEKKEEGHEEGEEGKEVKLDPETLESADIEIEGVTQRPAIAKLYVTGAVELNPERTEMATPLVGGRIEKVYAAVGDYVQQGSVLAVISSPQLAQLHGKMHEARTQLELAERNMSRVQRAENRVAVLQAKAKLDEADATLKRTKRLIELGAGAGKDLVAAEANYRTAKADFDFQSNISLNKEIQEARAAVETSRVDVRHIEDEMRSLGVPVVSGGPDDHSGNTSLVSVRAPLSGVITERRFNSGAGVEAAVPIFAISNLSTVYVIANVPEANISKLVVGAVAEIRSESIGNISGRISYIDPRLDEASRTARVRVEVPNTNGKLRAGMFAEVGFHAGTNLTDGEELAVPSAAIQRDGERSIVFIPKEAEAGAFEVREVEIGAEFEGYTMIKSGLEIGEKVVTKGSFILKTQMQKGELGDDDH
ncbi:MAG: efflux RND transporter periplasmic adaptor subunit [Pyrinomonadaceae bacterium]|jgi:cobalt-zinc-cadmium efflux system membrane fusion protein